MDCLDLGMLRGTGANISSKNTNFAWGKFMKNMDCKFVAGLSMFGEKSTCPIIRFE